MPIWCNWVTKHRATAFVCSKPDEVSSYGAQTDFFLDFSLFKAMRAPELDAWSVLSVFSSDVLFALDTKAERDMFLI